MKVEDRIETLRRKRLNSGKFDPSGLAAPQDNPAPKARKRRLYHCEAAMRELWRGVDYRCDRCGLVIEAYDDLLVDGYTGQPALMDSSPFIGNLVQSKSGKTIPKHSLNQKRELAAEAKANGQRATARKHGIAQSTLQNYIKQVQDSILLL